MSQFGTALAVDTASAHEYSQGMDVRTEQILLEQIRDGDAAGFEELVAANAPQIINLAYRLVGNRQEAEDIAQEAFLRLHKSLSSFRGESRISTWLYRTVSRLAIDHLRREQLKRKIFFFRRDSQDLDPLETAPDFGASPPSRLIAQENGRRIALALEKLSPQQKAVFVLRHQEDLPLKEIAQVLKLKEGTVKAHLHRAISALRKELKDLHEVSS